MANSYNIKKVLEQIKPGDKVLDIGGHSGPFNRANYVIDLSPYETRQKQNSVGGDKEYFTKNTWVIQDVCDRKPFPFPDKFFDYVFCSHVLEDIRDPIWVCSEINRISKKGYLEFPSPKYELSRGVEGFTGKSYVGNAHHRWIIKVEGKKLIFIMKYHFLNGEKRFSVPHNVYKKMKNIEKISFLFFEGSLDFQEINFWDENKGKEFFERMIYNFNCRNPFFWKVNKMKKSMIKTIVKIKNGRK